MFIFSMLVLSRYYWALIVLMFLLRQEDMSRWRNIFGDILILFTNIMFYSFSRHETNAYSAFMIPSLFFFSYFIYIAGAYLVEDGFFVWDWFKKRKLSRAKPVPLAIGGNQAATLPLNSEPELLPMESLEKDTTNEDQ